MQISQQTHLIRHLSELNGKRLESFQTFPGRIARSVIKRRFLRGDRSFVEMKSIDYNFVKFYNSSIEGCSWSHMYETADSTCSCRDVCPINVFGICEYICGSCFYNCQSGHEIKISITC